MDPLLCAELAALDSPAEIHSPKVVIEIERGISETLGLYIKLGVEHILPAGADHLLFVLALLLSTSHFKRLLLQISLFTLAHSVTLILAALSLITFSGSVVEVLIALSIAIVGLENIVFKKMMPWRLWIIFVFGLLHGLGFAGALQDTGLPKEHLIWSLLGFNLGVEIAQLLFAAFAFLLLYLWMKKTWYRKRISIPASVLISLVALWWVVERV